MTNPDFYPNKEQIKARLQSLEEEKRTITFQIQDLNEQLRMVQDEIKLLETLLDFLEHGKLTSVDW